MKVRFISELTKREILVEIWLKSADGDRKETKNHKRAFERYPKGANMHKSQENSWAAGYGQAAKVDYWPTIYVIKK